MNIFILAAAITAIVVKAPGTKSKIFWSIVLAAGFFLIPSQAFIVAPVVVFIGIFFQEKLEDMRGS